MRNPMRTFTKKGFELSINFLVMLILALTIFGFGVSFIYKLTSDAQDLRDITSEDLDEMVGDLFCSSSDRVCIFEDTKSVEAGNLAVFGIKVINIQDKTDFKVLISQSNAFNAQNGLIDKALIIHQKEDFSLERNEERSIGIGIDVPKDSPAGTYVFNLQIQKSDGSSYLPGNIQNKKLYLKVRN